MDEYKHREVDTTMFMGEEVKFLSSNKRLKNRVNSLSNERYVLQTLIEKANPDDTFWDVGACLGIHTFVLAKHLSDGDVVGFEPMPINRGVLMDNRSINELTNVWISKSALSDEDGQTEFAIRESFQAGFGRHSLTTEDDSYEKLKTIDIGTRAGDSLVQESDIPAPNIVKIDAEGAGPLVLQGMEKILTRNSCRVVVLETHEPNPVQPSHEDFGWTRADIISFLESCGFDVTTLREEFHLLATKTTTSPVSFSDKVRVNLIQGDIADQQADALVNSAGTSLRMGSGVAGTLRERGGETIHTEAIKQGPVDPGETVVTGAGELDAEYIIHAASMPHHGQGRSTVETVYSSVLDALQTADSLGCSSIVVPAVGCGLGGLSLATGTEMIGKAVQSFTPQKTLTDIELIAYTSDEYRTMRDVLNME